MDDGFEPCQWEYRPCEIPSDIECIHIDRVHGLAGIRYAVRQAAACMNHHGEWEFEPIPSSRRDEWLAEFRFPSLFEAKLAILAHVKHPWGRCAHSDLHTPA